VLERVQGEVLSKLLIQAPPDLRTTDVTDTGCEPFSLTDSPSLEGHIIGACPVGFPEGECGGELWVTGASAKSATEDRWARCRTCKTSALVDWWLAQMSPATQEWLPMRALRWHLLLRLGRRVSDATIRAWARDPELLATRRIGASGAESRSDTNEPGRAEYRVRDVLVLTGF
jgi:hypothetical protein